MLEEYNKQKAIIAQKRYVEEKELPHFAPENGFCWKCGKNIYEPEKNIREFDGEKTEYIRGITLERAETSLVTGCPHCNISYCD